MFIQPEEKRMRPVPVFFIILIILIATCDHPFSTRDPESPNTSQSLWFPPHTPEDVLINLNYAVQERNAENYLRCFISGSESFRSFQFVPDPEAAALYPHLHQWTREQEETMIQETVSLVPEDSSLSIQFTEIIRDVIAADSAVLVRTYRWQIRHNDPALPRELEGQVEFRMAENNVGEWWIYQWIDNSISEIPSVSIWKAALGAAQ